MKKLIFFCTLAIAMQASAGKVKLSGSVHGEYDIIGSKVNSNGGLEVYGYVGRTHQLLAYIPDELITSLKTDPAQLGKALVQESSAKLECTTVSSTPTMCQEPEVSYGRTLRP